jgi:UDP-N-acetyl-D-glucosamine dehydrogenase
VSTLEEKIAQKTARIGVVGLGYVGLPLAVEFAAAGFTVVGIEIDAEKVVAVNAGESYIKDVPGASLAALVAAGRLRATTDYAVVAGLDTISICVPTPLSKTKDPDISYVVDAADAIAAYFHPGLLVVLESSTYPGTTDEVILPRLAADRWEVGRDFYLAFSPERIDPGNPTYNTRNIPRVIGGVTPECTRLAGLLYAHAVDRLVPVSSTRAAETVKLLENTFRMVNIGLVNEMAIMCDKLGIDVWEVINAAATKPFGFMPFYPGPGLGGHCIPVDPHYLSWKLKTLDYNARFIELAAGINAGMPRYVVEKVQDALNARRQALNGARVLVLGVTYKPDIDDVRESPALDVIGLLEQKGALVYWHDPIIPQLRIEDRVLDPVELTAELLTATDCVVITTDHSSYDYGWLAAHAPLIVDTRNALRAVPTRPGQVVKL